MNIKITQDPTAEDLRVLEQGMKDFEMSVFPGLPHESEDIKFYAVAKSEHGEVIGGIKAYIFWNGLEIDMLWVEQAYRGRQIGTSLIKQAEATAIQHGAVVGYLKTVMAKGFYERMGYSVYGVLEDRPIGSLLYHMKKRLV